MLKKTISTIIGVILFSGLIFSSDPVKADLKPQYGGTLRIINSADALSLMVGEMSEMFDYYQSRPAIETLVRFDERTQRPAPFLAKSVIEDAENQTVTFKLRKGIKFHDGTSFDAKACQWNLEQAKIGMNSSSVFANVTVIEIVDAYTVRLRFKNWDNSFLRQLCHESGMISPTAFKKNGLDWARVNPVGTGPFKLVKSRRDVKKVFERFDGYWQKGKPYLDRLEISIIGDPMVQIASLLKGNHDVIVDLNPTDAQTLKGKRGIVITQGPTTGAYLEALVGDSVNPDSPFSNLKVRQAVSYAIDRESINDYVYHGLADVTHQTNTSSAWSYNPSVKGYPYNPRKARALLAEAGYPNGFSTTLWCRSDQLYQDMYTAVQSNLADVGVQAKLQLLNFGKWAEMFYETGWKNGLFAIQGMADTELAVNAHYGFSAESTLGEAKVKIHPEDSEEAIARMVSAKTFEHKKAWTWKLQYLWTDKYALHTPIVAFNPLAAKSSKVHGEYTSAKESGPMTWTFADAWIEK